MSLLAVDCCCPSPKKAVFAVYPRCGRGRRRFWPATSPQFGQRPPLTDVVPQFVQYCLSTGRTPSGLGVEASPFAASSGKIISPPRNYSFDWSRSLLTRRNENAKRPIEGTVTLRSSEVSHESVRKRERILRRFKSMRHAQLFVSVYSVLANLFRVGRQKVSASNHRILRSRAFDDWREVSLAC